MLEVAVPILPGAATAGDVVALMEHDVTEMKFHSCGRCGRGPPSRPFRAALALSNLAGISG
jgi:2-keto-3-deoxy-6-phosphogluconate aldolase